MYIFVSIVILLLTYILIVAYSYDDVGSKYNTDWYNDKYNISFTSSNKLFRMDNHIALIHMLMGTKLILKWIIIVEVSLLLILQKFGIDITYYYINIDYML